MDTTLIEKQGYSLLQPGFDRIQKMKDKNDLVSTFAAFHKQGVEALFNFYVFRDLKKSDENIMYFTQGGLSLPDRDYYIKSDDKSAKIREEYVSHITKMLTMIGHTNAAAEAKTILALETELAQVSMARVDMRNEEKTYHKYDFTKLQGLAPSLNFALYFKEIGSGTQYPICVNQPDFYAHINKMVDSIPLADWKSYLTWHYLSNYAAEISNAFVVENFNFNGKFLNGQQEMRPRWKRALSACDGALGEVVGQIYVEKYFSEASKQRVKAMVANILVAYKARIENLDWMGAETKKKALEKLALINTKFGYPDKWKDYSKLEIKRDAYVSNAMRAEVFNFNYMMSKLGKPVDKGEWQMLPHQVNAYYEPTLNEIVFPAAIMQPPFFFPDGDDAINYGAIGAVIGHEITHGFDDQGSKYDGKGNMADWWTADDRKKFDEKAQRLIDQYDKFEALPGEFVNGKLTIGENIADLGGINTSFAAYMLSLKGQPGPIIDGFTPQQRFYISFAQVWKGNIKDEALSKRLKTDVHSPGVFRVLGIVSNLTDFYAAFNVKPGDKMYRDESVRAKIW